MKVNSPELIVLASIGMLAALPAWSHHSTAMFDYSKTETVTGTIREFQWTNPHSYVQVVVPDGKGGKVEWSIEAGTPSGMARLGWARDSLKPGDRATVTFSPMSDGTRAGTLRTVTLQDGKVLAGMANVVPEGGEGKGPPLQFPTLERATPKEP